MYIYQNETPYQQSLILLNMIITQIFNYISWISGSDWNEPKASCRGQTRAVQGTKYPGGSNPAQVVVEQVLSQMSKPVYLLNVTSLSQLRKDGHPSIYGYGGKRGNDCSHWCLPGVPDTWNQLLYASLILKIWCVSWGIELDEYPFRWLVEGVL